ncbi:MAG TPA: HD domain-containing protein [Gemmatimonadaceae bacterium]|nr:HD domain-containing protein [Gemmatimonadaceae bacterium]
MNPTDLVGTLDFLRAAEKLKTVTRSGWTSTGRAESVAEHTWRLCLLALVLRPGLAGIDYGRLLPMLLVHDLGEAIRGDIPAPEQAAAGASKAAEERADLLALLAPLPEAMRAELTALWDEYEANATAESRVAKALDKLETILQHNQGRNPSDFDYRFNLAYGQQYTGAHPLLAEIRALLDEETEARARAQGRGARDGR